MPCSILDIPLLFNFLLLIAKIFFQKGSFEENISDKLEEIEIM